MPRRKKNGQSPARHTGGPPEGEGPVHSTGYDGAGTNNFPPESSISSADKEEMVKSMKEMFSHLDREVIFIVLSECDFKAENAMDSLLELSVAAEKAAPIPPPLSGFERTAAALLSPHHLSEPRPDPDSSRPLQDLSSPPSSYLQTDELDLLVDQELNTLTAEQDVNNMSLSSFPPPPFTQQALPELLQTSMELGSRGPSAQQPGGSIEHVSGSSSPLDQLRTWKSQTTEGQQSVVDFSHLMTETCKDQPKPPPDLAASGRPSAFQVYKKQNPSHAFSESGLTHTNVISGGARAKESMLNVEPPGYVSSSWNLEAPAFSYHTHGNQGPAFITPMAHTQPYWTSQHRHASPWLTCGPPNQAPLKHSAPVPKSWTLNAALQVSARSSRLHLEGKLLVLLRGAPGSGKSTLARALLEHNPGGVILSTDDYFIHNGQYLFDPTVLGEAHEWNHKRAKEAFERGANPIIIDNTNMQGWEMKPYVAQALKHKYKVLFREPDTWWKNKARELERRSTHNIPVEKIRRMLDGYERFVSIQSIMGSQMPEVKRCLLLENKNFQQVSSGTPCPDLVGQPGQIENFRESQPQLFSSLPDVSSVGRSEDAGTLEDSNHKSSESLNFPLGGTGRPIDTPTDSNWDDDIDLGALDSELDTQVEMNPSMGNQRIPDCVVESVMNVDHCGEEAPVAFCDSIGQRVRRERLSRRSGFNRMERVYLVKDTNQSDNEEKDQENREADKTEMYTEEKTLNFVGDWPCQQSFQQRQERSKKQKEVDSKDEGASRESNNPENTTCAQLGPGVTEFQKLLDLIQTGVAPVQSASCRSDSLSPSSGDKNVEEAVQASQGSTSSSDEREPNITRGDSSRGELPDCVLDWKAADSVEVNVCSGADYYSTEGGSATNLENNKETRTEADDSNISETCRSPVCDSSVETESSVFSGNSQERKQRQSRRSGKQCKLALTFTQNCSLDSTSATSQNSISDTDVKPDIHPDWNLSPELKTNLDLFPESKSDALLLPPTPLDPADAGCSTQTEPQDFGLLWRLNRLDNSNDTVVTAGNYSNEITVMSGDSSRFVPTTSSTVTAAATVHPSNHREVPYRVVHEKGTQVEEKDLGLPQDRLESLQILSCHFRQVSFDTLEDLYDKCHQDLEWTTNLLLDSGEKFFREQEGGADEDFQNPSNKCVALDEPAGTSLCPNMLDEQYEDQTKGKPAGIKESIVKTVHESHDETANKSAGAAVHSTNKEQPETEFLEKRSPQTECSLLPKVVKEGQKCDNSQHKVLSYPDLEIEALGGSFDKEVIIEESRIEIEDNDITSMEEVNRLLLEDMETEERKRKKGDKHLDILSVELKLPTELALQLTELFGPVGVDPGMCSAEDNTVQMDLNLAKLLHQKWKETIQERQRQEALSFHLLQESSVHWGDSQAVKAEPPDQKQLANILMSPDGYTSLDGQSEACGPMPFMDHWNVSRTHVSLRDIIKEEQMLQENVEKTRQSRADLDRRDGSTLLKENQLYSLFPAIDRHFLLEIFRDHNYSLAQTEQFLRSLLDEEPVKMVVAPAVPLSDHHRAASKEREKVFTTPREKQKPQKSAVPDYQDTEDPEYEDFRAEARLQRSRQLESFSKAAEAYKQGRREVASFYAQQGHMHGQRMREANDRAAAQIFEKINASLLPRNILDLHGLHVDEALEHLAKVLQDKTTDRPQLSVITGRGNHSHGGVARIRPAVIDYLTNRHYRFTEPKPGLVLVSLK